MAELSTGDGRPMEAWVGVDRAVRLALHDRSFRSLARKIGHHLVAINASGRSGRIVA